MKELLYPVGKIVLETAISTEADMITHYGGSSWVLLSDTFLIGAGNTYNVNATGGATSVTLTESNLPAHTHTYTYRNSSTGSTTLTTNQIPSHSHKIWDQTAEKAARGSDYGLVANNSITYSSGSTGGSGSHSHSIGSSTQNTGSKGSGTSFSILPTYTAVYIWKRTS